MGLFNQPNQNESKDHYKNMPEYNNEKLPGPEVEVVFRFRNLDDYKEFKDLIQKHLYNGNPPFIGGQKKEKKVAWYPHNFKAGDFKYVDE